MPQAFQFDDLYLHRKPSEIHCIASVQAAACTVRAVDREQDGYTSCIWAFPLDGGAPRQLTRSGQDSSPRWAPDGGQLAFVSQRTGPAQVHLLDMSGGEPRPAGALGQVSAVRWAPDGRSLLATATVAVNPELRGARGGPPPERGPKSPELAWRLPYKADGMGYLLARETHLFRIDLATGAHRQLTDGPFDVYGFDPSPDGRQIAYCRTRAGRFAHRTDLWVCGADGGDARQFTREIATVLQPAWSPDGRWIAFAGAKEEGSAQNSLYLCEVASGRLTSMAGDTVEVADGSSIAWSDDGTSLVFTRARQGCHEVCRIGRDGQGLRALVGGERQFGAIAVASGQVVFSVEHPAQPSELFACRCDGGGERQLSDLNPWWKERTPLRAERRQFQVPDGHGGQESIDGWLIRAEGAAQPQPLLNDVHGGPASYALLDFDTNVFWQVLCSQGWAVLALNAVGSASYGRAFCERLAGRWGALDLPQHLEAIRQLQRAGVCDERVAVSGKSYGGFLSAWAVGHTDLFRAAVVMAPVGNIETHYGTSDGGYYADPLYMASAPGFDRRRARDLSPLQHIEKSATPVLFLQGKEDERCPKCQSEEMFVSLLRAGDTPAELVLYPGEDHHLLSDGAPSCRVDAARRIAGWVTRWAAAPVAGDGVQREPQGTPLEPASTG